MRILSFTNSRRAALLVALTAFASTACNPPDSASDDTAGSDLTGATPPLSDDDLAAALASPTASLTQARSNQLVHLTLAPVATTKRLKLLNDFIADGMKAFPAADVYGNLSQAMEGIYWGTPRDLASTPPGLGGQNVQTSVTMDEDGIGGPTEIKITGVASEDYTLTFTVADAHITVARVPKGSTAIATAKLIGAALRSANKEITDSIGSKTGFDPIGGDHAESPSGIDDVEVSTSRGRVTILVALNG